MKLRVIDFDAEIARENARLAALDVPTAIAELLRALDALKAAEAHRLKVPFLDPTYHGCDPDWRRLLYASTDLRRVLARDRT